MSMNCNSLPNYRYELVSSLGGGLSTAQGTSGRTMTRWSLVVCSLAVLLVLSVSINLSGSGSIPSSAAPEKKRKTLLAEGIDPNHLASCRAKGCVIVKVWDHPRPQTLPFGWYPGMFHCVPNFKCHSIPQLFV